ncbi:protoporphyrinogen oxidase [Agrococcus sp. KRD186]|uniref:protoporphyrinogen oxidase n=1 Tax=Agrococcus sp. KRD186 TaxID=2729730 RepID=UPI0031452D06
MSADAATGAPMAEGTVPADDAVPAGDAVRPDGAVQADASAPDGPVHYDTIVAGAGIAGLTIAHDLAARGYRVLVLEAAQRTGGTAAKLALAAPGSDALALDAGAESFAVRGGAVAELIGELGMADDIVEPNPAGAWLLLPGSGGSHRAVPLPKRTLLGIPSTPLAQDVIDALGWGGALRAHLDRLMPVLRIGTDDALGPLVRRRMGQKVLDRLVAPLAGGVYSADPEQLDLAVVAPGLNGGITRTGSLSGGVALVLEERAAAAGGSDATGAKPGSAVQGLRGGIHRIAERLAERARGHHAEIRTGERVQSAAETGSGWLVTTDAGSHAASSLVVALPEAEARRLLATITSVEEPAAKPLASRDQAAATAPGVSVELVTLVFPAGAIEGDPRGTGVLVAADATQVRAKAMTHATAKWAWLREAAGGREIVRLSYGSGTAAPATAGLDAAAAAALALEDARAIFGTALPQPLASARVRWQQGQPASIIGARQRQQALRDAAAEHENLLVVGAAVAGTGLAQVVPDARRAALEIRRERFAEPGSPWTADIAPDEALDDTAAAAADADKRGDT